MNTAITIQIPDMTQMPDRVMTAAGGMAQSQLFTSDNIAWMLNELGFTLRYNVMLHATVLVHDLFDDSDLSQSKARLLLRDMLTRVRIKGLAELEDTLSTLARDNPYHPMMDWIESKPWDKVGRFGDLVASVPTDSTMWPTYLRRWLIQVVEAVYGWQEGEPRSLPNVLTFVGDQGIGKGRWLRALAPGYLMSDAELHLGSTQGKDHQIQALRHPIVELGEIDSTFRKADVSALKGFLSRQVDEIREPFGRKAIPRMRGTVFAGTVNDFEFLNDPTGTRRYWPVHVTGKINWGHGVDMQQLFAQVVTWWEAGEEWFLGEDEEKGRVTESEQFVMDSAESDLLADLFYDFGEDWDNYCLVNKTGIARLLGIKNPNKAQLSSVTQTMRDRYGPPRKLKGVQRCWCVPCGDRASMVTGLVRVTSTEAKKYVKWR